jgi:hypothetical protein
MSRRVPVWVSVVSLGALAALASCNGQMDAPIEAPESAATGTGDGRSATEEAPPADETAVTTDSTRPAATADPTSTTTATTRQTTADHATSSTPTAPEAASTK